MRPGIHFPVAYFEPPQSAATSSRSQNKRERLFWIYYTIKRFTLYGIIGMCRLRRHAIKFQRVASGRRHAHGIITALRLLYHKKPVPAGTESICDRGFTSRSHTLSRRNRRQPAPVYKMDACVHFEIILPHSKAARQPAQTPLSGKYLHSALTFPTCTAILSNGHKNRGAVTG